MERGDAKLCASSSWLFCCGKMSVVSKRCEVVAIIKRYTSSILAIGWLTRYFFWSRKSATDSIIEHCLSSDKHTNSNHGENLASVGKICLLLFGVKRAQWLAWVDNPHYIGSILGGLHTVIQNYIFLGFVCIYIGHYFMIHFIGGGQKFIDQNSVFILYLGKSWRLRVWSSAMMTAWICRNGQDLQGGLFVSIGCLHYVRDLN